jgi:two-component system, NarL family, sensor histidine kinase DesK
MGAVQGIDTRQWPDWRRDGPEATRRVRLRSVAGASPFLVFLVRNTVQEWGAVTVATRTALVAVAGAYSVSYLFALFYGPRFGPRARTLLVCWLYVTAVAFPLVTGDPSHLAMLSYAVAAGILLLPLWWGGLLGLLSTAALMIGTFAVAGAVDWNNTFVLVILTVGMVVVSQLIRTVNQLRAARDEIRVLAVAEERARVARDLHDVLGHSLTTITMKTGLARRLLESGADPELAIAEVRDVEQLSRHALTDIRATVSGYRRPSLAAELAGAREALRAAGIEAVLPQAVDEVAAELRDPFAYVLREGITNVIRHSGATRCEVRIGPRSLEIRDDGRPAHGDDGRPAADRLRAGGGLTGLAERMDTVGGHLSAEPLPGTGFRLIADAPEPAAAGTREPAPR